MAAALPNESRTAFRLYVTHVEGEGHFLKISGHRNRQSNLSNIKKLEALFIAARENLENGIGSVPATAIYEGLICAVKSSDGMYYRAEVINTSNIWSGLIEIRFLDFGNKALTSLNAIRILDSYDPILLHLPAQAIDYYLATIIHPTGQWKQSLLMILQSILCFSEHPATVEANVYRLPLISIQVNRNNLLTLLLAFGCVHITLLKQIELQYVTEENQQMRNWQLNCMNIPIPYMEGLPYVHVETEEALPHPFNYMNNLRPYVAVSPHVPMNTSHVLNQQFNCMNNPRPYMPVLPHVPMETHTEFVPALVNQNSSTCTLTMPLQENLSFPCNCPLANEAYRNPGYPSAAIEQSQQPMYPSLESQPTTKKCSIYKNRVLEINSEHEVVISFLQKGPSLFAVQFISDAQELQDMMDKINNRPLRYLTEMPQIGNVCLGRSLDYLMICRTVVVNSSANKCKLFFVDYGNTELVSYHDMFIIPEEFTKPNVFAQRFCLSNVKTFSTGPQLFEAFYEIVNGKVLTLRVVEPEGPPLIEYCELYLDKKNVLDLLKSSLENNENVSNEINISNQLEMLALNETSPAHVVDMARGMNQLSQPRNHNKTEAITSHPRERVIKISSPQGSVPSDNKRRYRNEQRKLAQGGGSSRDRPHPSKHTKMFSGWTDKNKRENLDSFYRPRSCRYTKMVREWTDRNERRVDWRSDKNNVGENRKELPNPLPLDTPFVETVIEPNSQHEVFVTWIISPENFYIKILSLEAKFREMMDNVPELYVGVWPYNGPVAVGASVMARYPEDGKLYRATVVSVQPFSKFIVQFIDHGYKKRVDATDIWQMDKKMMELPKMAIHCSLIGVGPKDGKWKCGRQIYSCFKAPRYRCVFQERFKSKTGDQYNVSLSNEGVSVADMLVEKQYASVCVKDKAIDLGILEGQHIQCRVTHVESFDKFFVQLDLDKAALIETDIANFVDANLLTPLDKHSVVEGAHCTVKHQEQIFRGTIQGVMDTANITVLLGDYGNVITTTLDKLMILPKDMNKFRYQSLKCCFNNYTQESKALLSLDELKERLTGNKFIIYINSVDKFKLVSTLYDKVSGQKISIFEPDEGVPGYVGQLCNKSLFNYEFGLAYISHLENLNEIYLQKTSDCDKLTQMRDQLFEFYEEGTPEPQTTFEIGELCAAKSSDGYWYRAAILYVTDTQVKIQFRDYGDTQTISKHSLKKLDIKFYEPCALALVVSLDLVALSENSISELLKWTNNKEIRVTLADRRIANLHLDTLDLSMKLINEKLATTQIKEPKLDPVEFKGPVWNTQASSQNETHPTLSNDVDDDDVVNL